MSTEPTDIALECENISKCFRLGEMSNIFTLTDYIGSFLKKEASEERNSKNDFWALKNISFQLKKGEALGIIGRNGAGKSTLLKILSRITPPTEGRFGFNGSLASLLEVGMGFKQELTGRDNIFLSGSVMGLSRAQILEVYNDIVEFSEIEKFIDTPVKRYSSGMFVRLAFAVAAHLNPDILIIDEVLAVGDLKFQKKCLQKMSMVAKAGKTVIFVSHNTEAVAQLCNKVIYIEKGQMVCQGDTNEVIQKYQDDITQEFSKEVKVEFQATPGQESAIRSFELLCNNEDQSNQFDILEPIPLKIDYELLRDYSDIKVVVFIYNIENNLIWSSFSLDWYNYQNPTQPKFTSPKAKGHHSIEVEIPAPILNTGQYEICVSLAVNFDQVFDQKRGLYFNVTDYNSSYSHIMTNMRSPGQIVQPMIWKDDE